MVKTERTVVLILILFFSLIIPAAASADGSIDFSVADWDTGVLEPGIIAEQNVDVTNNTGESVVIDLISTCSCLSTDPAQLTAAPGETVGFSIFFDSSEDIGDFEKLLIVMTDSPVLPKGLFVVTGSVAGSEPDASGSGSTTAETGGRASAETETEPQITYYYTPGCKSCNRFLRDAEIPILKKDITDAVYFEELQNLLNKSGQTLREVPVLVAGDNIFQGEEQVKAGYTALLDGYTAVNNGGSAAADDGRTDSFGLSLATVIAAGLLDGVNPCAFTTLIFLLSALSVAGRSRRETLIIGLFFTAAVFVTYFLIGLGFFRIIRIADSFDLVSRIIRWLLFAVLIVFAALSFFDYGRIRAGKASEILLQLPDGVKRRMHSSIRSYTKSAALAGSAVVMGFLISIFELGCTGQIYFPTITYIIQTGDDASGYLYLLFYNIAFILPLAAVFIVVYFGITSKRITKIFQANMGIVKLLTGILFIAFALLMVFL